jgi:hypothetical protein
MSIDVDRCFVVGVSFIDLLESVGEDGYLDFEERMSGIAEGLGFNFEVMMSGVDIATDAFIGVRFDGRPSDVSVERAKKVVASKLSEIEALVGSKASSGVEEWLVVSFC